jgi:CelD/BcsL family acetyltransferase involved in cellulose biosynthesis
MSNRQKQEWEFSVLRGRVGFQALQGEWQALVDRWPQASYVQQPGWIASYLDALCGSDRALHFVTARARAGGALCGVLVLKRRTGLRARLLSEMELVQGPHLVQADVVADLSDVQWWPAMLAWLDRPGRMRWRVMQLPAVMAGSALHHGLALDRNRTVLRAPRAWCAWLDCRHGVEYSLNHVSPSFQHNLRRLTRRAQAQGALAFHTVSQPDDLGRALDEFIEVEASGWKKDMGTAIGQDPRLVFFYQRLVCEFGWRGCCRIHLLTLDGRTVAAQFALVDGGQLHLLKIGFSQAHAHLAPGHILMRHVIEQVCLDPALDRISFVTSPDWARRWKPQQLAVEYVSLYRHTWTGRWLHALTARSRAQVAPPSTGGRTGSMFVSAQ